MNRSELNLTHVRRTTADELFDQLRSDIEKMRLLPGSKLSEANVARQYNVSRQPVREALIRLDNLDLVRIQPQKATIVRPISMSKIRQARFIRLSVELEIARLACAHYDGFLDGEFESNIDKQQQCINNEDFGGFNSLDLEFHALLCRAAGSGFAINIIDQCKNKVDRLCMLSLTDVKAGLHVLSDHQAILQCLHNKDLEHMRLEIERHQQRLNATIDFVQKNHQEYFCD